VKRRPWTDFEKQARKTPTLMPRPTVTGFREPLPRLRTSSSSIGRRSSTTRCMAVRARKSTLIMRTWKTRLPTLPKSLLMMAPKE